MFSFPNPVNEVAARVVAGGVVVAVRRGHGLRQPWLLVPLAYGFWARVLTGPTLSPLGQLATRVVAPRLRRPPASVAGPPKRFAQAIGVAFSTDGAGAVVRLRARTAPPGSWSALLAVAALLESAFGLCLGCRVFGGLMRIGLVPDEVCEACADISAAPPRAAARSRPDLNRRAAGRLSAGQRPAGARSAATRPRELVRRRRRSPRRRRRPGRRRPPGRRVERRPGPSAATRVGQAARPAAGGGQAASVAVRSARRAGWRRRT